jgi:uncharacterized protein (DUF58 family)
MPTKAGFLFVGLTIAIGVAAANTGHNFLYLTVSSMLAFIIASGLLSDLTLWSVEATAAWPDDAVAGERVVVRHRLVNGKRRWPALMVRLALRKGEAFLPEPPSPPLSLPPLGEGTAIVAGTFRSRGLHPLPASALTTTIPFLLFTKRFHRPSPGEIIVFPAIRRMTAPPPPAGDPRAEGPATGGGEPSWEGLRHPREEEPARLIHWKVSARIGHLVARDEVRYGQRSVIVTCPLPAVPPGDGPAREAFEEGIVEAASLVVAHHRAGWGVGLALGSRRFPAGRSGAHLRSLLTALALAEPGAA